MFVAVAGLCGFIFGWGLLVSGMVQPAKVMAFLDFAGAWDPSLALTMGAALAVSCAGYALAERRAPIFAPRVRPSGTGIDRRLVLGSLSFGIGWGLVGLCPAPAFEVLASLSPGVIVFVAAMTAGMALHEVWSRRQQTRPAPEAAVAADG